MNISAPQPHNDDIDDEKSKPRVLYICASQFSGSTLAAFVLNTHPDVTTVGHTMGWHFEDEEDFLCSCGKPLSKCEFFRFVAQRFSESRLPFEFNAFGTEFRLARNDRLNRYLVASLPLLQSSLLESWRDALVLAIPPMRRRLAQQLRANEVFAGAALDYHRAGVFVDNSHDPYRLSMLARMPEIDLRNIALVRDPRGVVRSCMTHAGWSAALSAKLWVRRQSDTFRILGDTGVISMTVRYEDLCEHTDDTLSAMHEFMGVPARRFDGDFSETEHHILGNAMRLRGGQIRLDERWRADLQASDIAIVNDILERAKELTQHVELRDMIEHYLERS